jgi:hypothetical protein
VAGEPKGDPDSLVRQAGLQLDGGPDMEAILSDVEILGWRWMHAFML